VDVSLTVNGRYDTKVLIEELKRIAEVEIRTDRASISVVGNGISYTPNVAGRIFDAIGSRKINVEIISSGASEINVSFVVKENDAEKAVKFIHERFFGENNG
jgi:aspartate kinase